MFGIVIDKQGFKVEFVALNEDKSPQFYELKEGETIVEEDWQIANSMNKPQWNGTEWIDTDPLPPVEVEPSQPTELELIKQELETLKLQQASFDEIQTVQAMLIDDLVFEVIPSIEQQVQQGVEGVTLNNMISRGSEGMAGYLARKIIEGRDYRTVFKTNAYKQYQDEVDTILELEGHAHLIKRDELGVL